MIDNTTGRFCLAHSIEMFWKTGNAHRALFGLPPKSEIENRPLTDLLCGDHRYWFLHISLPVPEVGPDGKQKRYASGVPSIIDGAAYPRRVQDMPTGHLSQADLLGMLEHMEECLRNLEEAYYRAQSRDVIAEQPTVVLPTYEELCANDELYEAVEKFLEDERRSESSTPPLPSSLGDSSLDDPDDRISGEE